MTNLKLDERYKNPSQDEVKRMYGLYLCGMSLQKLGKKEGYSRQWLWHFFKQQNFELRKVKRKEQVEYNGKRYTWNNKGYFRCTNGDRHILHYRVWEENTGSPVPQGYEVLHRDRNKRNFSFLNLELVKGKGTISRMKNNNKPYRAEIL